MKKIGIFLTILTLSISEAQTYRRLVNFEWEPILNAASYEIELAPKNKKEKPYFFKTKQAAWNGRLSSGYYMMRLRSVDKRGVAGTWSNPEEFIVNLEKVKIINPKLLEQIRSNEDVNQSVEFKWEKTGGADFYEIEILNSKNEVVLKNKIEQTRLKTNLEVAQKYSFKVNALNKSGLSSESFETREFTLYGKKLDKPIFNRPENLFVRDLIWTKPNLVESYDLKISKFDRKTKKWIEVTSQNNYTDNQINFSEKWTGGKYKASLRAKADLREPSNVETLSFDVHDGDRSPAAEHTATIRQSIERTKGWYAIASYLVTIMDYESVNKDALNTSSTYSAFGGTGRLGLGYLSPEKSWGFLGIVDLSGFIIDDSNFVYPSIELHGVHRGEIGERAEFRTTMGLYYKELPETIFDATSQDYAQESIKTVGPHLGSEFWYSINPKLGFQINARAYYSLLTISTPNKEKISPTLSYQLGLLGSYRLKPNITGLMGIAKRTDSVKYESTDSGYNETTISGTYLNLFLEWAF